MKWNIFCHNINKKQIEVENIFNHGAFSRYTYELLRKCKTKEEFGEKLKSELLYYFWCKAEYEVMISAWCGGDGREAIKVDIYTQIINNWDVFLDYVWNCGKKEIENE